MPEQGTAPAIIIDELFREDDPATTEWLEWFDGRMQADPATFQSALDGLGEAATSQAEDSELNALQAEGIAPERIIRAFFTRRLDRETDYDDTTRAIMAADETHSGLVEAARSKVSYRSLTGVQSSVMRSNLEANPARDAARRSTLGMYLKRIIAHRGATGTESPRDTDAT